MTADSAAPEFDPLEAKAKIIAYCLRKGALAAGIADLDALERIAPPGHRPRDLMPKVRSVVSLAVGGQTRGAWSVPARALGYFGSAEGHAYKIAYGCAFYIEHQFYAPSVYCPPDMDPKGGTRIPFQSLKLHAELAGIGARSLAGDILLHPQFGFIYVASVFTELELPADQPLAANPCPAPSCVALYRQTRLTPCAKFCPAQCLSGEIDEHGRQAVMRYEMAKCAQLSEQYEAIPGVLAEAANGGREDLLYDPAPGMLWYKMSVGQGGLLGQCFECMRVCPIATRAPLADPILRATAASRKAG